MILERDFKRLEVAIAEGRLRNARSIIKILKPEVEKLLRRDARLSALEAGGVDNWEWYGDSLREHEAAYLKEYGLKDEEE